jgi:hypothetical protein
MTDSAFMKIIHRPICRLDRKYVAKRRGQGLFIILVSSLIVALSLVPAASAEAQVGVVYYGAYWVDACQAPNVTGMWDIWTSGTNNTVGQAEQGFGIYLPGAPTLGCPQPNLSSAWVNDVADQGLAGAPMDFDLAPTWDGLQNPCSTNWNSGQVIPLNNSTLEVQDGETEAADAYLAAQQNDMVGVVYDDLEAYHGPAGGMTTSCLDAEIYYVIGWVAWLHAEGWQADVYGSVCGSDLVYYINPPYTPDDIWGAWPDGSSSTGDLFDSVLSCGVPSGDWTSQQRLKQYTIPTTITFNPSGYTDTFDEDCANSSMAGISIWTSTECP